MSITFQYKNISKHHQYFHDVGVKCTRSAEMYRENENAQHEADNSA
jgi:hypothetical protein